MSTLVCYNTTCIFSKEVADYQRRCRITLVYCRRIVLACVWACGCSLPYSGLSDCCSRNARKNIATSTLHDLYFKQRRCWLSGLLSDYSRVAYRRHIVLACVWACDCSLPYSGLSDCCSRNARKNIATTIRVAGGYVAQST